MIKNITNPAEIAELYFDEPRLGYYLPWDSESKDDVHYGLFIGRFVIDLNSGRRSFVHSMQAVKYSDKWIELYDRRVGEEIDCEIGFPYWEEEE